MNLVLKLIQAELEQRISEGRDEDHDDQYQKGELAFASVCSTLEAYGRLDKNEIKLIPAGWLIPKGQAKTQALVKAAALLVAEIERLYRECESFGPAYCDKYGTAMYPYIVSGILEGDKIRVEAPVELALRCPIIDCAYLTKVNANFGEPRRLGTSDVLRFMRENA